MKQLLLLTAIICCVLFAEAQIPYNGVIVNNSGQPIAAASIRINEKARTLSNADGSFQLQYSAADKYIYFTHIGYAPLQLSLTAAMPDTIVLLYDDNLLDETIVYAFEKKDQSKNLAAAVSVLTKQRLQQLDNSSLVTAVNTVPGVKMDERSPGSYRLSIRGNLLRSTFGVRNVKVYWNGIPFTDASGNTYLNALSPEIINRIEIIKGPSGSMYGSGTGGVVLLGSGITEATPGKQLQLNLDGGSYGYAAGSAIYQSTGTQQSTVAVSHQQADGYRSHTRLRRDVAQYTGNYRLNNRQQLKLNLFMADHFYQTPGALNATELAANPRQSRPAAGAFRSAVTQNASIRLKTIYTGLLHEVTWNKRWQNSTGVYGSYTDFINPTIRNYENKYEQGIGGRTVLRYSSKKLTAHAGAELQQGRFNSAVFDNNSGVPGNLQLKTSLQSVQANAFLQTEFSLPAGFLLSSGISYNRFYYGYRLLSNPAAQKQSSPFKSQWVPRISLLKQLPAAAIYIAVSKGYSVPSIDEVNAGNDRFNSSLQPETAINYEVGYKAAFLNNKLTLNLALYQFYLQQTIVSRRDSAGGDFYSNAGKTSQRAAELALQYKPLQQQSGFVRSLQLDANGSFTRARFINYQQVNNLFDGNRLTGTPANMLNVAALLQYRAGWYSNFAYSYTGRIPLNDANSVYAPAYQLLMAKLGYSNPRSKNGAWQYYAAMQWALNNPFSLGNDLNAAAGRYFNPSAPLNFTLGLRYALKLNRRSAR